MAFKNETSLDDLALFALVAETGTLTGAAERSGTPLPTLSRRMKMLEASMARRLFTRGASGMALTEEGRALAEETATLTDLRHRIAQWRARTDRVPFVRITAGSWTALTIARNLRPSDQWRPAFVATPAALDLPRREADIGIRRDRPDHPWLAVQKLRPVEFAIYAQSEAVTGYVGPADPNDAPPSQRWLAAHHGEDITTRVNSPRLGLDIAQAGLARVLLPRFIGDEAEGLMRLSDNIAALTHDQWLVSHHDARHDPPIRAALDRIASLLS